VGSVEKDVKLLTDEHNAIFRVANQKELEKQQSNKKNKMRGKNKISAKLRKKQKNVIDAQMVKLKERQAAEREAREWKNKEKNDEAATKKGALQRFHSNKT